MITLHRSPRPADTQVSGYLGGQMLRLKRPTSGALAGQSVIEVSGEQLARQIVRSGYAGGGWERWDASVVTVDPVVEATRVASELSRLSASDLVDTLPYLSRLELLAVREAEESRRRPRKTVMAHLESLIDLAG